MIKNSNKLIGRKGEALAGQWLQTKGYKIIDRNWCVRAGELDIVASKNNVYHFIEIKSCWGEKSYYPEESLTSYKQYRIINTIYKYLDEKGIINDWQFDLVLIQFSSSTDKAMIRILENYEIDEQVINSF